MTKVFMMVFNFKHFVYLSSEFGGRAWPSMSTELLLLFENDFKWFSVQIIRTRLRNTNSLNHFNDSFAESLSADQTAISLDVLDFNAIHVDGVSNDAILFEETTPTVSSTLTSATTTTQKPQPRIQGISQGSAN